MSTQSSKKITDIKLVTSRASVIFVTLILLMLIIGSASIVAGWKSGDLNKQIVKPMQHVLSTINKATNDMVKMATSSSQSNYQNSSNSNSNSNVNIEVNTSPYPTDTPYVQKQYVYPTATPYPTIEPGRPGSKEWDEQFWKNWNDMQQKINQNQQQVEQNQKQFCIDNPSLCQ